MRVGNDSDRYKDAAETAFTDEISENNANVGLLFIKDAKEPSLVYDSGNTAVSLSPLMCQEEQWMKKIALCKLGRLIL